MPLLKMKRHVASGESRISYMKDEVAEIPELEAINLVSNDYAEYVDEDNSEQSSEESPVA